MVAFHATLSEQSVWMRYLEGLKLDARTAHERLVRICSRTTIGSWRWWRSANLRAARGPSSPSAA